MNILLAKNALCERVVRAAATARLRDVRDECIARRATHLAVFRDDQFCGLVDLYVIGSESRILADLIPKTLAPNISPNTRLDDADHIAELDCQGALGVVDGAGRYIGSVTHNSLLGSLLQRSKHQVEAEKRLKKQAKKDADNIQSLVTQLNQLLTTIGDVQRELASGDEPDSIYDTLLAHLLFISNSECGFMGDVRYEDTESPSFKLRSFENVAGDKTECATVDDGAPGGLNWFNPDRLIGPVITSGEVVISHNPANDSHSKGLPPDHHAVRAFLGLPLYHEQKLKYVLGMTRRSEGYTRRDVEFLRPLLTTFATILESHRYSQRTKQSEARLQAILETASEGIGTIDRRGVVQSFNEAASEMFGYRAEEVVGQNVSMLMPAPHREQHDGYLADYLRTGLAKVVGIKREVEGRRKDGTLFPMELNVSEVNTGGTHLFTAILRDLTESKRTEKALRESDEYVRNIIGSMIDTLIVVAPDGSIVTVNAATCTLLGYREEELIGQPASILFEEEEEEEELTNMGVSRKALPVKGRMLRTLISVGHVSDVEGWYAAKDGSSIPVTFSGSVMRDGEGQIQGVVCVAQDSTQKKQLQCELTQAQKLESVGQLAAGIAHEINTPTQYLGDNTRFLKDGFGDLCAVLDSFENLLQAAKDGTVEEPLVAEVEATLKQADVEYLRDEIPQAIDQSLHGVDRVAKIVRAMKEFSHPGGEEKSLVNLTQAIETTITVARNEWKYVAEMVTEFAPDLPQVFCLPGELNQVFLNLIVNAGHAISDRLGEGATEKGIITVGTRHDGEWVEIFVRDTGTGIPDDVRARIFDPFFTTKEVGKGTGQGLAIARSVVVDKHGGTLNCETEQGKGTTFIVHLPIDGKEQIQGARIGYEDACYIR